MSRPPSTRRALGLVLATGAALVGVALVAVAYLGLGVRTLQAAADPSASACLRAYAEDADVRVRYELLPPRSVCADGAGEHEVASSPAWQPVGGVALAAGGALGSVLLLRRRPAAPVVR